MSIRYNRKIRFFPQEMHIPPRLPPFFPEKTAADAHESTRFERKPAVQLTALPNSGPALVPPIRYSFVPNNCGR
jgi:hypothetical protein